MVKNIFLICCLKHAEYFDITLSKDPLIMNVWNCIHNDPLMFIICIFNVPLMLKFHKQKWKKIIILICCLRYAECFDITPSKDPLMYFKNYIHNVPLMFIICNFNVPLMLKIHKQKWGKIIFLIFLLKICRMLWFNTIEKNVA